MAEKNNDLTLEQKADALNKEAWEIRVSDSNRAFELSSNVLEIADSANYLKGKAQGLRTKGFCYIRFSRFDEAKEALKESEKLFLILNDLSGLSDINEYFGIIARSVGDYGSSLDFLFKGLELRQKVQYRDGESLSLYHIGVTYRYLGNLEKALEYFLQSLSVGREIKYWIAESYSLNNIGSIYFELDDYTNALEYYHQSLLIRKEAGDKWGEAGCLDNIGYIHFKMGEFEEAKKFCNDSLEIARQAGDKKGEGNALFHLGEIHLSLKQYNEALSRVKQSMQIRETIGDKKGQAQAYLCLSSIAESEGSNKERQEYLIKALKLGEEIKALDILNKIHFQLYSLLKQTHQYEDALYHFEIFNATEKEIHSNAVKQNVLNLEINHKVEQSKKEAEIFKLRNIELADLYEESEKQRNEINKQKKDLETAIESLKTTQARLIQSEKMASLGELTAGIAHEIQNPLNFVNNFSEVSNELIDEMKEDLVNNNYDDAKEIADDLKQNLEKIYYHGNRASDIVKGMLQHSRTSTGKKESTDLNALCEEYLRLSYHGLRAKDKDFNATMQTDFDETIGKINIVQQDIGRVILNLINNAFYAVTEKNKTLSSLKRNEEFEPTVSISTKKINDKVEIRVSDNGTGIPQKIIDKIFQPFFTTKPTGQGVGLGLSLSYDIIKAHAGEIKVESNEGEGAKFVIQLPA